MKGIRIIKVLAGADTSTPFIVEKATKNGWKGVFKTDSIEAAKEEYCATINPIKGNRLVDSMTFAIRFRGFLEGIQVCDACGEEELEYMKYVADSLVEFQKETVEPNSDEERYLKNCGVLPK